METAPQEEKVEKEIRVFFIFGLILKGLSAFIEIAGGLILLFTGSLSGIIAFFARRELIEDPSSLIAGTVQHVIPYISAHAQLFISAYLLAHGIIKVVLVVNLLKNNMRSYPWAIAIFSAFALYEIYRYSIGHSLFLLTVIIFDLLLVILTWHEYRHMKNTQTSDILKAR